MSESPRCPKCGIQLPADAPAGLCPKCLVQAGFESQPLPQAAPEPTVSSPAASGFAPPSVEELAGKFPQLEILELLGKGGMGAVYKARQPGLDRLVAVKILPPEISHDPTFADRFQREARALARLTHPHIVAVYDFGQTALECGDSSPLSISDGAANEHARGIPNAAASQRKSGDESPHSKGSLCYFVMEFVDGANLRQAIRTGTLTPQEALAIVPQICEALQFAHDEGIVHRDIKPENILIDKKGRVKIADFGLAKLLGHEATDHSLTGTNQVMGTVRYMAPEQMEASRAVDHRADIYSLGVVFYEMLTGELPLGRFAPPSEKVQIDVRLDEVVLRSLEKEPERRYQQASEVKTDVENIARQPSAPPSEPIQPSNAEPTWETWWFEQSAAARKMMRLALCVFAIACLIAFGSSEGKSETVNGRIVWTVRVGLGESWFRYKTGVGHEIDFLQWSFVSGVVGSLALATLFRIQRAERRAKARNANANAASRPSGSDGVAGVDSARPLAHGAVARPESAKGVASTPHAEPTPADSGRATHAVVGLRVCGCMMILLGIIGGAMGFIGLGVAGIAWFQDASRIPRVSNVLGFVGMIVLGSLVGGGGGYVFLQRNYHGALLGCLLSFALALMMKLDDNQNAFAILGFVPGAVGLYYLLQPEIRARFKVGHNAPRGGGPSGTGSASRTVAIRPRSVTVLAVLNILIGTLLSVLMAVDLFSAEGYRGLFPQSVQHEPAFRAWMAVAPPLQYLSANVLLVAGIGLLLVKRWGRTATLGFSIFKIGMFVVELPLYMTFLITPLVLVSEMGWTGSEEAAQETMTAEEYIEALHTLSARSEEAEFTLIGLAIGLPIICFFELFYPILLLVVMQRPNVKAAFAAAGRLAGGESSSPQVLASQQALDLGSPTRPQPPIAVSITWPRLPAWFGWAFTAAFVVAVVLFVATILKSPSQKKLPPPSVPDEAAGVTGSATGTPAKTGEVWSGNKGREHVTFWGSNSPTVSDRLARHLGLDPSQRAAMNQAFQTFVREFKAIEEQNTRRETDANGHQITTIVTLPIRQQLPKLADRFWSELDSVLDGRQLSLGRKVVDFGGGMFDSGPGFRIKIWRVGQINPWYHWKDISGISAVPSPDDKPSSAPELPEQLRRFWKEPAEPSPSPLQPHPFKLRAFDPAQDQAIARQGVTAEEGTWRIELKKPGDTLRIVPLFALRDAVPESGMVFYRAKVKWTKTGSNTGWMRAKLLLGDRDAPSDGQGSTNSFEADVTDWLPLETRYPAYSFHQTDPPALEVNLHVTTYQIETATIWIKDIELWHHPAPPPEPPKRRPGETVVRSFTYKDKPIQSGYVNELQDGWRFTTSTAEERTVRLFDVTDLDVGDCRLILRARMKTAGASRAWLEMTFHTLGGGTLFPTMPDVVAEGDTNWSDYEVVGHFPAATRLERVRLNLRMLGKKEDSANQVWIKDVELLKVDVNPENRGTTLPKQPKE